MDHLLTREHAPIIATDTDARRVTVRLFRWNDPRPVRDQDGLEYREAYAVGALELADDMDVKDRHGGVIVGRVDADSYDESGDGPTVDLILSRSTAGNDVLADVDAKVLRAVSVEVEPLPGGAEERDGTIIRTKARLHGVAFAFRPAHDAPILATRDRTPTITTTPEEPDMTDTPTPTAAVPANPEDVPVTVKVLERSMDELRDDMARTFVAHRADDPEPEVLKFRSLGHYAEAVWNDPQNPILRRALTDQIASNNLGVIPDGWVRDVKGIVDRGRAAITAFGQDPLPPEGMDVNWPVFNGDIWALVSEQVLQKTAIASVQVDIDRASSVIRTFAGGSDIAYQLIRRSGPSYLATYLRIMTIAYAAASESAACSSATAIAVNSAAVWDPATGTVAELAAALFQASVEVETATGLPASFVLAASDVFPTVGAAAVQTHYNPTSAPGIADASTLQVGVGGLMVRHAPGLAAGTILVSNNVAGRWHGEGPWTVTAEDVERLGQDTAVWGMGVFASYIPSGIRKIGSI